jgi:DNA-binding response OmpR family regulator
MPISRVLLVSSDAPVVESLAAILRSEGFDVLTAHNPDDAISLLHSFSPAALVLDLTRATPVSAELLQLRHSHHLPLLVLSSSRRGQRQAVTIGADAFLSFPVLVPDLLATIRQLCEKHPSARKLFLIDGGDRRASSRPERGDVRPCPHCGYVMRFEDFTAPPLWICRNEKCGKTQFVRVH